MSQIINCSSCGAANQLPEGKSSMFCAFCGTSIQEVITSNTLDTESTLKMKPEISKMKSEKTINYRYNPDVPGSREAVEEEKITDYGGKLSLTNRGLKSLNEIIVWFSDNELLEVKILDLTNNKIKNLIGLERFDLIEANFSNNNIENIEIESNSKLHLMRLDLSNNKIKSLKGLSSISLDSDYYNTGKINLTNNNDLIFIDDFPSSYYYLDINFSNCKNLKGFSQNANKFNVSGVNLTLFGCENFDFLTILFLNDSKLRLSINIEADKKIPQNLIDVGFVVEKLNLENNTCIWKYKSQEIKTEIKTDLFPPIIASMSTWNWVTLFSPYLLATLVIILLGKIGFHLSFLGILIFCYMFVIFLFLAPYMEHDVKTGRSFKTKYGKIDEYKTELIGGTIDSGKMAGNIVFIHFLSMLICIFIFFKIANNNKTNDPAAIEAAPVAPVDNTSSISTAPDPSAQASEPYIPAVQNSENSEVDENGEQIDDFIKYNVNCIKDLKTNYYWYIAPDKDFNFEEASSFSKNISERNLNWRVPTYNEIKSLYNSEYSAGEGFFNNDKYYPAKIHNVFNSIGSGSWFWVSDENSNSSKAYAINLHEGVKVNFDKNSKIPVHLLLISN